MTLRSRTVRSESMPETTMRERSREQRRYARSTRCSRWSRRAHRREQAPPAVAGRPDGLCPPPPPARQTPRQPNHVEERVDPPSGACPRPRSAGDRDVLHDRADDRLRTRAPRRRPWPARRTRCARAGPPGARRRRARDRPPIGQRVGARRAEEREGAARAHTERQEPGAARRGHDRQHVVEDRVVRPDPVGGLLELDDVRRVQDRLERRRDGRARAAQDLPLVGLAA